MLSNLIRTNNHFNLGIIYNIQYVQKIYLKFKLKTLPLNNTAIAIIMPSIVHDWFKIILIQAFFC